MNLQGTDRSEIGARSWSDRCWPRLWGYLSPWCRGALASLKADRLGVPELASWTLIGAAVFHIAYAFPKCAFLILVYLFVAMQLGRAATRRGAFYSGLALGLLTGAPRLAFFWTIFSAGAIALWLVYAFWIALFVTLTRAALRQLGPFWGWMAVPVLWTGLEYFRSELYYLRFAWLSPAYGFSDLPWNVPFLHAGAYGLGFVLAAVAALAHAQPALGTKSLALLAGTACVCGWGMAGNTWQGNPATKGLKVAAVQMEVPAENEVVLRLTQLLRHYPDTDLIVLSEYTFNGPIPAKVREWCRKNRRYLIVGGTDPAGAGQYYNTAFVIGPDGQDVFKQVKGVPIQFFKDGLPAPEQRVWASPWGKLGICICYDLSYRRITDRLVAQGAEALIVPTMDVMDWGIAQHELHGRIAPIRAAEYGIPIFRVASSGISQLVDRRGGIVAAAPCPGAGAELAGFLPLAGQGNMPWDHWLAPVCTGLTCGLGCGLTAGKVREKCGKKRGTIAPAIIRS